jgi:hypothetical protein
MRIAPDTGACIHHLSHPDVASWIERTNRYTGRRDRARAAEEDAGRKEAIVRAPTPQREMSGQSRFTVPDHLIAFAHARIDHWVSRTRDEDPNGYPAAVALLRAIYDMVDCLMSREAARGLDGPGEFRDLCGRLDEANAGAWPVRGNAASGPHPTIKRFAAALLRRSDARVE